MGTKVTSALMCLLSVLVEAHCQTVPYVSFMGTNLTNHSYVDLTLVGSAEDGSDSVQCHTDLQTCCSAAPGADRGDWYAPGSQIRLPLVHENNNSVYEQYEVQRVDLRRRYNGAMSGMYHCNIETIAGNNEDGWKTVYVGLYTTGGDVTIQNDVRVSVDSDLNGESPRFSLTCTSIGGPATTATWTRDFQRVSGGMTVLDDPVTAQYTHTLTVTGRLGGLYQCTVSNNKPSTATAQIRVPDVFSVAIDSVKSTTLTVSWSFVDDTLVTSYSISYSNIDTECFSASYSLSGIVGSKAKLTLTDLEEATEYTITVSAMLTGGGIIEQSIRAATLVAAPSASPTPISVSDITHDNITVQWGAVDCIHQNGNITGYSVRYGVQGSGSTQTESVSGGATTEAIISELKSASNYSIEVAAVNSAGTGIYSNIVFVLTSVNVPVVAVDSTTATTISLSWTSSGSVVSYEIFWIPVECPYEGERSTIINDGSTSYIITGLRSNLTYTIYVRATNAVGSADSDPVTAITKADSDCPGDTLKCDCGGAAEESFLLGFLSGVIVTLVVETILICVVFYIDRKRKTRSARMN